MELHNYVNKVIALVKPKRYNDVCSTTASKTTLRTSLVLIWLDDSPYSSQSFDKTINPTTDHEDQLVKISSFFNTHTRYPLKWTKSDKLLSSNSPSCCSVYQLAQGIQHRFLEKGWFMENQLDHKPNIAVRWQPGNTSERIIEKSRTTDMLLSSRTILLPRQDDVIN